MSRSTHTAVPFNGGSNVFGKIMFLLLFVPSNIAPKMSIRRALYNYHSKMIVEGKTRV